MKIVAPLVIATLLSWMLYRKVGTWEPIEVWSKNDYDASVASRKVAQGKRAVPPDLSQYHEGALDLLERRKFEGQAYQAFDYAGGGRSAADPIQTY